MDKNDERVEYWVDVGELDAMLRERELNKKVSTESPCELEKKGNRILNRIGKTKTMMPVLYRTPEKRRVFF